MSAAVSRNLCTIKKKKKVVRRLTQNLDLLIIDILIDNFNNVTHKLIFILKYTGFKLSIINFFLIFIQVYLVFFFKSLKYLLNIINMIFFPYIYYNML
jgi:hypothetical protein